MSAIPSRFGNAQQVPANKSEDTAWNDPSGAAHGELWNLHTDAAALVGQRQHQTNPTSRQEQCPHQALRCSADSSRVNLLMHTRCLSKMVHSRNLALTDFGTFADNINRLSAVKCMCYFLTKSHTHTHARARCLLKYGSIYAGFKTKEYKK